MSSNLNISQEEASQINIKFDELKKMARNTPNEKIDSEKIDNEVEENIVKKNIECKNCNLKTEFYKSDIKTTDAKAYAIKKLVELFSVSEEGERANGRKVLLIFSLIFIAGIFLIELIIIILQGLEILKLDNIIFLGTIGSITSAIIFTFKLISKYLYNNEKDKILETIVKLFEK